MKNLRIGPVFIVSLTMYLCACAVNLDDRTSSTLFYNPPLNSQPFQANTAIRGGTVNDVKIAILNGATVPMTSSGNDWDTTAMITACEMAVFYRYEVGYSWVFGGGKQKTFPEAGVFSRAINNRPAECSDIPPQGGHFFQVNALEDLPDETPGDGVCATSQNDGGRCTLRAAVMEANALPGTDLIKLRRKRYVLSRTLPLGEEEMDGVANDAYGDLDITDSLVISGQIFGFDDLGSVLLTEESSLSSTFPRRLLNVPPTESLDYTGNENGFARVDGGGIDRIFQVHNFMGGEGFAVFENIAIVNGHAVDRPGGGIRNDGILRLDHVIVAENRLSQGSGAGGVYSQNRGAGIGNYGILFAEDLAVVRNKVLGGTGVAGGIYTYGGAMSNIQRALFAFNEARFGAALYIDKDDSLSDGKLTLINAVVIDNKATGSVRGAILNAGEANVYFSSIVNNRPAHSGLRSSGGSTTRLGNSIISNNGNDCEGTIESAGGNIVEDTSTCSLNLISPEVNSDQTDGWIGGLSPLQDNGGFLYSISIQEPFSDSSSMNPVDQAAVLANVPFTDMRGGTFTRPVDGDADGSVTADVGAFEIQ